MAAEFSDEFEPIINLAEEEARKLNHCYIETIHLFLAFFRQANNVLLPMLVTEGLTYESVKEALGHVHLFAPGDRLVMGKIKLAGRFKPLPVCFISVT